MRCIFIDASYLCIIICIMRTTLDIDHDLLEEAKALSGSESKKETVETALKEYIRRRKARKLLDLEGRVELSYGVSELLKRRRKDVSDR
jgi:Arc/MetJ family transcription regulator